MVLWSLVAPTYRVSQGFFQWLVGRMSWSWFAPGAGYEPPEFQMPKQIKRI